jgi:hypothetical protein
MRAEFSERCVHWVLRLHARGHATRAGITAVTGLERPRPSRPRRTDRLFGESSRRTASTGAGFGFQFESCFCELSERGAESVDGRTTLGFTRFRSGGENASVLKIQNSPDNRLDCSSRRWLCCNARPARKRLGGEGSRRWPTGWRVVNSDARNSLIQPSFLEFS